MVNISYIFRISCRSQWSAYERRKYGGLYQGIGSVLGIPGGCIINAWCVEELTRHVYTVTGSVLHDFRADKLTTSRIWTLSKHCRPWISYRGIALTKNKGVTSIDGLEFARIVNKVRSRRFAAAATHRKPTDGMEKVLYVMQLFGSLWNSKSRHTTSGCQK